MILQEYHRFLNFPRMAMIAHAEFPLNDRGAVYHLNLLPEELADTVITVGDPKRVEQISRRFDKVELIRENREFITHTGTLGSKRVSVISTGIGTPNIDIVLNELDALVNVDLNSRRVLPNLKSLKIIRLGTCGAIQPKLKPGEIIVSRFAVGFDLLMNFYNFESTQQTKTLKEQLFQHLGQAEFGYITEASETLYNKFLPLGIPGITVTSVGFYGPQNRILRAPIKSPEILAKLKTFEFEDLKVCNYEMETAAIYGLGKLLNHECVSVSAIIANRLTGEFSSNVIGAVERMLDEALPLIC